MLHDQKWRGVGYFLTWSVDNGCSQILVLRNSCYKRPARLMVVPTTVTITTITITMVLTIIS